MHMQVFYVTNKYGACMASLAEVASTMSAILLRDSPLVESTVCATAACLDPDVDI